jgi:TetR/AcrR family transcriptional regulator, cholesterol catabolism regulator
LEKLKENIIERASAQFLLLGIKSVSMDDICSDLGISKKTIYQIFPTKEMLVDLVITKFIDEEKAVILHLQEVSVNAVDEMTQVAEYAVSFFNQVRPILLHDLQKYYKHSWEKVLQMQSTFIKNQIKANLERGKSEGTYREDMDPEIISNLYVVKAKSLTGQHILSMSDQDRDKLIKQHMLYHIHGILSDAGREQFNLNKHFNSEYAQQ